MNTKLQKGGRLRFNLLEGFLVLVVLFMFFRLTAVLALAVLTLLYLFLPPHRSRRALFVAFALFVTTLLIPVDIYVPGFHGPLINSKHSGLRLVRVLYGLGARPRDNGEAIWGGCIVGLHDTRWRLVWD